MKVNVFSESHLGNGDCKWDVPSRLAPPLFLVKQCSSNGLNNLAYSCFSVEAALLALSSICKSIWGINESKQSTTRLQKASHPCFQRLCSCVDTYLHSNDDVLPGFLRTNFFVASSLSNKPVQAIQVNLLSRKHWLLPTPASPR